ncbi:MAG: DUF4145 domain-containing protein [Desulfomonilia bacterium]
MKPGQQLPLERCPHCNIAKPLLNLQWQAASTDHAGQNACFWAIYRCQSCGAMTLTCAQGGQQHAISHIWPEPATVSDVIPQRAKEYLSQAISSISAPAGAVMLAASAVDAMLKDKGYKDSSLNSRIDAAAKDHLITTEMAAWAHEIRLDANDQRHADEAASLPSNSDASKAIEFTIALAQFLYVLPARVERGRKGDA